MAANEVVGFRIQYGIPLNHLTKDVFKFIIRGKRRRRRRFLEERFHKFTADVFLFLCKLRFQSEPENGTTTVVVGRWFVNVDEDWFASDVNQIERTLLFGISIEGTVIDGTGTVSHLKITHPLRNVRIGSHDAVEVALLETWLVAHASPLLSSPP